MPETAARSAEGTKPPHAGTRNLSCLFTPSPALAAIVGAEPLTRAQATSRTWAHIRARGLQDPADKRSIVADGELRAVFERDHATMFELPGLIGRHLAPV